MKLSYHNVSGTPRAGVVNIGRGRSSGNGTKTSYREGWGVAFTFEAIKQPDFKYDPDAMFVLLTTVNDGRVFNNADLLEGYRSRNVIKMSFHWLKGDAAVAPMFLKLTSRLQAMGIIFVPWVLIFALIQCELRAALAKDGGKCPHPDKRLTDRPTTRGVLDLFDHITLSRLRDIYDNIREKIHFWKPEHDRVLLLLGATSMYRQHSHGATQ